MSTRLKTFKPILLLLFVTLVAYANSFHAPFQFDDYHQIANNEHIRTLSRVPEFFTSSGGGSQFAGRHVYRPLLLTSFAFNYALSGNGTWSYHLVNLVLHFLCALMVFLVVRQVISGTGKNPDGGVPLLAAALFAAHPIQTGAVTYISGRSAVAASLFVLLSFYCYMRHRDSEGRAPLWLAGSVASFMPGLLTKEMAVCLLGLIPAYELIVRHRPRRKSLSPLVAYALFLASFVAYFLLRSSLLGYLFVNESSPSVVSYLASMPRVIWLYIRLLLLPVNQNADYNLPITVHPGATDVLSALVLAILVFLLLRLRKTNPLASFFGLWFFIALLPESSVFPITDIAVEYRLYLASAGFIACFLTLPWPVPLRGRAGRALASAVLICLVLLTIYRNTVWASTYGLWSDVASKSPASARAHLNLGNSLQDMGRYEEAVREFGDVLKLKATPRQRAEAHNNTGTTYLKLGRRDDAQGEFEAAIREDPETYAYYVNLAQVLFGSGRFEESLGLLREADRLNPGRSDILYMLAWTYQKTGHRQEALDTMKKAFDASPGEFGISLDLARFYMISGMEDKALEQARLTASLAKDEAQARQVEDLVGNLKRR